MARGKRNDGTRAPNGASSIYRGKDGKWHGRVTMGVRDDGRPDRRHVQGQTEAEVTTKVRKLERARDDGRKVGTARAWTVEKWLTHWLDHIAAPSVRPKTLAGYRTAVHHHLNPGIGAHRMDRIQAEHIERLYRKLSAKGLKPATVHQAHRTLRTALNEAMRRGHIAHNPVLIAKAPRQVEQEIDPFTVEEAQRILKETEQRRNGVRFALALTLGLRQGEALGLQWRDVDLQAGTLTIRRAIQRLVWQHGCDDPRACARPHHKEKPCKQGCKRHSRQCPPPCPDDCMRHARHCPQRRGGGLVVTETKSQAGRRTVGMPQPLVRALADHRRSQEKERETAGDLWQEGDWLFTQPNGKPVDPRRDYAEWLALLKAARVRPARLHDARHTAATMLLVLKVPTRAVMDVMGWSQASMTARYQHVPTEVLNGIASQVGGLLWNSTDGDGDDGDDGAAAFRSPHSKDN